MAAYRLGVDLGTTFTAAATDDGAGPEMVGLGNRASQVPSVLFLSEDGSFLCGEPAERRGATRPDRVVREYKRRIGDTVPVLVAGQPFSPQALTAKMLSWVLGVVTERQGGPPELVVLTRPANWGGYKQELFDQVADLADLPRAVTMTEPEAAATQYAARAAVPVGGRVAVYDLGGGTFDVCVLEKQPTGFTILGTPDGVEHLGGMDFDEAVFRAVLEKLPAAVNQLDPDDPVALAGIARLRRDCVDAKEALSTDIDVTIPVALPGIATSVRLTREELEQLITPPLRETLAATGRTLRSADLEATDLSAVVLVGGSSRIPLVSHLLTSELGVRTALDTHPKHDVALGAARHAHETEPASRSAPAPGHWPSRGRSAPSEDRPAGAAPTPAPVPRPAPTTSTVPPTTPTTGAGADAEAAPNRRRLAIVGAAVATGLVLAVTGVVLVLNGRGEQGEGSPSSAATSSTTTVTSQPPTTDPAAPEPLVPPGFVVVPVGQAPRRYLVAVDEDGVSHSLPSPSRPGDQDLPALSPGGVTLQYKFTVGRDVTQVVVGRDSGPTSLVNGALPEEVVTCNGRLAWSPTDDQGAVICRAQTPGGLLLRVYRGDVTDRGQIQGPSMEPVPGLEAAQLNNVTYLPSGGLAVAFGGAEPGLRYVPQGGAVTQITNGPDSDVAASNLEGDDRLVFTRAGTLYTVMADGSDPPCSGRLEAGFLGRMCRLLPHSPGLDVDPAWDDDSATIVFRRVPTLADGAVGPLLRLDLGEATSTLFDAQLGPTSGAPAWSTR